MQLNGIKYKFLNNKSETTDIFTLEMTYYNIFHVYFHTYFFSYFWHSNRDQISNPVIYYQYTCIYNDMDKEEGSMGGGNLWSVQRTKRLKHSG